MQERTSISSLVISSIGLSGCVASDNAATTMGAISAATLLYYSLSNGYYYDQDYNCMPRNYRPASNVYVHRIDNMENYCNQHPIGQRNNGYCNDNGYRNQPNYQRNNRRNQPNYQCNRSNNPRDWNDFDRYHDYR